MGIDTRKLKKIYLYTRDIKTAVDFYNKGRSRKNYISIKKAEVVLEKIVLPDPDALPIGVKIFSIFLVFTSFLHMQTLFLEVDRVFEIYGHWPKWLFVCRYSFSWFQRILGFTAAIGILFKKDIFRKILIWLGVFTVVMAPIKHPYKGIVRYTAILDRDLAPVLTEIMGIKHAGFSHLAFPAMLCLWALDFIFWAVFIRYFTRPRIKELYKK